jgi:hypothetical protein
MKAFLAALVIYALHAPPISAGQSLSTVVTIGPIVHWNFGAAGTTVSAGLEGAVWHVVRQVPLGLDYGCEWDFGKGRARLYAEGELGVVLTGFGMGVVAELGQRPIGWALQSTIWANYLAGLDYRVRAFGSLPTESAFGLYAKWPFAVTPRRYPLMEG